MMCWLISVKPFDETYKNYLETINEFLVIMLSYFGFLFTDYVPSPVIRFYFGYFYLGILCFGMLVNVGLLGYTSILDLIKFLKSWKNKKVMKQKLAEKSKHDSVVNHLSKKSKAF